MLILFIVVKKHGSSPNLGERVQGLKMIQYGNFIIPATYRAGN